MKEVMTFLDFKNKAKQSPDKYDLTYTEAFYNDMLGVINFEFDDTKKNIFNPICFSDDARKVIYAKCR